MNKRFLLFLLTQFAITSIFLFSAQAQVNPQGVAPGLIFNKSILNVNEYTLEVDVDKLLNEDELGMTPGLPDRVAYSVPVNSDLFSLGSWIDLPDGRKFYQARLSSLGAYNLVIAFDRFTLPKNAQLFFYSPNKETLYGGFTHNDNNTAKTFTSPIIYGDEVVIEYFVPKKDDNSQEPVLHILELAHFYKPAYDGSRNSNIGASEECHININCPEGDDWQDQKRGVSRILTKVGSGYGWCSGSLINNTAQDGSPYFLTAEHCGGDASTSDRNQWLFRFNFEHPGCEDLGTPETHQITGCSLLAMGSIDGGSDMQLVNLNLSLPASFQPFFNGWDRSVVPAHSGVGIHHPAGDVKKISTFSATATNVANPVISGTSMASNSAWNVTFVATETGHSVTQGGSSGSPLFNQDGLITGTLTGGNSSCDYPYGNNIYGKLNFHWESNGDNNAQKLQPWLDPLGTGQLTLEGLETHPVPAPQNLSSYVEDDFKVSLYWDAPEYDNSDGWYAHAASYSNVLHETPERAIKFDLINALDYEVFYIKGISHLFWEHPNFPWSSNEFSFKIYDQDGETLLYESEVLSASDFQDSYEATTHLLENPIAVTNEFYIAVVPVEGGQPSSLSLNMESEETSSVFGSAGTWVPLIDEDENNLELLVNVYGSDVLDPGNTSKDLSDFQILGASKLDWIEAAQKKEDVILSDKVLNDIQQFDIYRDDELIHSTSSGSVFEYLDTDELEHYETYQYYVKAVYNLNPPYASDIISTNSNIIEVTVQPSNINQELNDELLVYPNPTNGLLTIALPATLDKGQLEISDISGRKIVSRKFEGNQKLELDLSGYKNGIYILSLTMGNQIFVEKIILH